MTIDLAATIPNKTIIEPTIESFNYVGGQTMDCNDIINCNPGVRVVILESSFTIVGTGTTTSTNNWIVSG